MTWNGGGEAMLRSRPCQLFTGMDNGPYMYRFSLNSRSSRWVSRLLEQHIQRPYFWNSQSRLSSGHTCRALSHREMQWKWKACCNQSVYIMKRPSKRKLETGRYGNTYVADAPSDGAFFARSGRLVCLAFNTLVGEIVSTSWQHGPRLSINTYRDPWYGSDKLRNCRRQYPTPRGRRHSTVTLASVVIFVCGSTHRQTFLTSNRFLPSAPLPFTSPPFFFTPGASAISTSAILNIVKPLGCWSTS